MKINLGLVNKLLAITRIVADFAGTSEIFHLLTLERYTDFPPKVIENELEDLETRNLHLIENWQVSGKVSSLTTI